MNTRLYKPLFVLIPIAILLAIASHGYARDVLVTGSSASECRYTLSYQSDLSDLTPFSTADSATVLRDVHFLALPANATARITQLESRNPAQLDPASRSMISSAQAAEPLAQLGQPFTIRGRRLVPMLVSPVAGNAVYGEVEIVVTFAGGTQAVGAVASPDPFFDRVIGSRVINNQVARTWPKASVSTSAPQETPFGDSNAWYRIEVSLTGLHRITGAELQAAGVSLGSLSSNSIRIFNGGGAPLPVLNAEPTPDLTEIAIMINDGGDGQFGVSDRLYFFGEAVDRWIYEAGLPAVFLNNVYETHNVYWLTTSGTFAGGPSRMATIDGTPGGAQDTTISRFTQRIRSEQDNLLLRESDGHIDSYHRWYWTDATTHEFFVPTAGYIPGDTARVLIATYTGGTYADLQVNANTAIKNTCGRFNCDFSTTSLTGGLDRFTFDLQKHTDANVPYFDYMELRFASMMVPVSNKLDIPFDGQNALAMVTVVDNFTASPLVFDLADTRQPRLITGAVRAAGTVSFDYTLTDSKVNRVYLSTPDAAYAPDAIAAESVVDLAAQTSQTDLIVVTPQTFVDDVAEYVDYRSAQGHAIKVVAVEDIMANFGYGLYDPTAIRNYLKFAYENFAAPAPYAVLFVGDGTYDYLDHLGTGQANYVPSYIHDLPGGMDRTYSDDNFVYFGTYGILDADTSWIVQPDRGFDMMTARWPVKSAAEIDAITSKIMRYELPENLGSWRNRITYVADDERNPDNPDLPESFHVNQSEVLSGSFTPSHFEQQKLYLWSFPYVNNQKPTCNDAIVQAINNGTVIINYVGHGNPDVWAHERVFTRQSDLPRLTNRDQLPLVFAASCAIGFFDDPKREGMAEDLLAMNGGGAIGVLSATRLVYSFENAQFNRQVFDVLLYEDDLTICEAVFVGKVIRQYGSLSVPSPRFNDRTYVYLGDPFTTLGDPQYSVEFTTTPDSLTALGRSQVAGRLVDDIGQLLNVNGTADIEVFDSDRRRSYVIGNADDTISYNVTGPSVYRGTAEVVNGLFTFEFITPLDIGIGGTGARISVYGVAGDIDAIGLIDSLPVSSIITPTSDSAGPEIVIEVEGRTELVSGEVVGREETLIVTLTDSSGINLATGLGHGITLEIDGDAQATQNLTDRFAYRQNDFTSGSLTLGVADLEPGMHTLKFKAWDNANNSATVSFTIEVVSTAALAIQDLLNYPNPMADSTTFFFELTQSTSEFDLEIFTLAGRKIKSIRRFGLPVGSHQLAWDGRDGDGDRIATGVYIYKASARSASDGNRVESFGKVVVIN